MNAKYRRMTWTDRLIIEKLYNSGASYLQISRRVGFAVSSVHREIQRGLYPHMGAELTRRPYHYSAQIADDKAAWLASSRGGPIKLGAKHDYANYVSAQIKAGKSPDEIVGCLRRKGEWTVSTVTLYRYIDQGFIPDITNKNLLVKARRKREYNHVQKAARAPAGVSIERRPAHVGARATFGHWEMDSVIGQAEGKGESILVLTERLTRYEIILKVFSKSAAATVRALKRTIPKYPDGTFKSITVDNGSEFSDYEGMKQSCPHIFYCHPYTSCERGSNENANRIIRRFFLKGQSMAHRTQRDCDAVAYYMNQMHRKILNYANAAELFAAHLATL